VWRGRGGPQVEIRLDQSDVRTGVAASYGHGPGSLLASAVAMELRIINVEASAAARYLAVRRSRRCMGAPPPGPPGALRPSVATRVPADTSHDPVFLMFVNQ